MNELEDWSDLGTVVEAGDDGDWSDLGSVVETPSRGKKKKDQSRMVMTEPVATPPARSYTDMASTLGKGIVDRAANLLTGFLATQYSTGSTPKAEEFAAAAPWLKMGPQEIAALQGEMDKVDATLKAASANVMAGQKQAAKDIGYQPMTDPVRDLKEPFMAGRYGEALKNVPGFAAEQFITSIPNMVAAMLSPQLAFPGETGRIAMERAENDKRDFVTDKDMTIAAPVGAAITVGERLGLGRILQPGRGVPGVIKAGATEGATEFVQEGAEDVASTIDTEKGWDPAQSLEMAAYGAIGGAPAGAVASIPGAIMESRKGDPAPRASDDWTDLGRVAKGTGTKAAPVQVKTPEDVADAGERVNREPTEGQKQAGNYAKGHVKVQGLPISIENPKGGERKGKSPDGGEWSVTMPAAYGYVRGTKGADGDHVDVFVGDKADTSAKVFVIDQVDHETGNFDEHKAVIGTDTAEEAARIYADSFSDGKGPDRLANMVEMSMDEFKTWARSPGRTKKPLWGNRMLPPVNLDREALRKPAAPAQEAQPVASPGKSAPPAPGTAKAAPRASKAQETAAPDAQDSKGKIPDNAIPSSEAGKEAPKLAQRRTITRRDVADDEAITSSGRKAEGVDRAGHVTEMSVPEFKGWLKTGDTTKPLAGKASSGAEGVAQVSQVDKPATPQPETALAGDGNRTITPNVKPGTAPKAGRVLPPDRVAKAEAAAKEPETIEAEAVGSTGMSVQFGKSKFPMETYKQASEAILKLLDETGGTYSGETGPKVNTPLIVNAKGETVAYISQNGKVWEGEPEEWTPGQKPLYDPYAAETQTEDTKPAAEEPETIEGDASSAEENSKSIPPAQKAEENQPSKVEEKIITPVKEGEKPADTKASSKDGDNAPAKEGGNTSTSLEVTETEQEKPKQTGTPERRVVQSGVVLRTKSGRETSPAPKIDASTGRKASATIARMNAWLLDEAKKEAEATGQDFVSTLLKGINPANMSQADQDQVNLVLFDDPEGATEKDVVEVKKPEKKAKPKAETEDKPKADKPAADPGTGNVFEDAGDKIGGARKDWRLRGLDVEDLATMTAMERAEYTTKENTWPRPDYAQMVADGAEPTAAYYVKVIYDSLPRKPRRINEDDITNFVTGLSRLRSIVGMVKTAAEAMTISRQFMQTFADTDNPNRFGPAYWDTMYAMGKGSRSADLTISSKDERNAKAAVAGGFPEMEPWTRLYRTFKDYNSKWQVINRGRTKILAGPFETEAEAIESAKALYEAEGNAQDGAEQVKTPKRPTLETLQRSGKDWRSSKNVETTDEFKNAFGFKGVEFGEWATQKERQLSVNAGYDALYDLADVLNLPPRAMSFNGLLSMAFGARGKGSFLAHYEPHRLVINMTKLRGAGALAHEWGHALDHYLGELSSSRPYSGAGQFLTGGDQTNVNVKAGGKIEPRLRDALQTLMQAIYFRKETNDEMQSRLDQNIKRAKANLDGWKSSRQSYIAAIKRDPARQRSLKKEIDKADYQIGLWENTLEEATDNRKMPRERMRKQDAESTFLAEAKKLAGSGDYWIRNTELFARSFEAYVFDKVVAQGNVSQYLVHGVEGDRYATGFKGNPYPAGAEREAINKAYDKLISVLKADQDGKIGVLEGYPDKSEIAATNEAVPLAPYEEPEAAQPLSDIKSGEDMASQNSGSEQAVEDNEEQAYIEEEETRDERSDEVRRSASDVPAGTQSEDVSELDEGGDAGQPRQGDGGAGGGTVRDDQPSNEELAEPAGRVPGEGEGAGGDPSRRGGTRAERDRVSTPAVDVEAIEAERETRRALNYQITDHDKIGQGTPKQKVRANIEAIRTLKTVEDERRQATDAEKRELVRYVGWGAFAQDVFAEHKPEWASERSDIKNLLSPDEYAAARRSTLNAHYTSEEVIRGMWDAMRHLGFRKGRAIEPSAGVGHFVGLAPRTDTDWSIVELDGITGRIARVLYAGADVNIMGFEDFKRPKGFYDLAMSNVPFGDYRLTDDTYPPLLIHDYFFVKSLDLVRPGGFVTFITSSGTMDKAGERARKEIQKRADLIGAIRLPGGRKGAFASNAGTEVTTDILFLRRRADGAESSDIAKPWTGLKEVQTKDGPATINEYFADNPHMMLGEMRLTGTMYREKQAILEGTAENIGQRIADLAREHLPKDAYQPAKHRATKPEAPTVNADGVKEGAFFEKDGKVYRKVLGVGRETGLTSADEAKVRSLMGLRDLVNDLLKGTAAGNTDANPHLREKLNKAYDAFVKKHGPINQVETTTTSRRAANGEFVTIRREPNFKAFKSDPDAFKVAAIEIYNEESGKAVKAAIFTRDILGRRTEPTIQSAADALAVIIDRQGIADIEAVASLRGASEKAIIKELGDLIYQDPAGHGWMTSQEYLSGDVLGRLDDARRAAKTDPAYERNVKALEDVQPAPIAYQDIHVPFGASWVPPKVFEDFISDSLGTDVTIRANPLTKKWQVIGYFDQAAKAKWGHQYMDVEDVVSAAINQTMVAITHMQSDGSTIKDEAATLEVRAKVDEIRKAFAGDRETFTEGWVWQDAARIESLAGLYNRLFNRIVTRKYDGSHLSLPGLASHIKKSNGDVVPFELRPHQKNSVWRMVQAGNTLLAHVVGAGKTFTMIAGGMEMRRLGQIQRPMYIVPNHMLEQFSREFLQAYPNANILVANKDEMSRDNRKAFVAKVAAQAWDGIVITHSAFGHVSMSDAAYVKFLREEIDEIEDALIAANDHRMNAGRSKDPTVKQLEKAKARAEDKIKTLQSKKSKDDGVTFEEMGVDFLFVDEAHLFKNLVFYTRHTRVKGLGQGASQRATDLFMKIRFLDERTPGRSAVFASGTPISNTVAEAYTMQRYLQLPKLKEYGIDRFDAWSSTFGEMMTRTETSADGRTFKDVTSFSRFVNIPELVSIYNLVTDTQTADMLNLPRPKFKNGKVTVVEALPNEREESYIVSLIQRLEAMKGAKPGKGEDNALKIVSEGRKVATDFRLIDPEAPFNEQGKTALLVRNITKIWKEGKEPGLVQMVFLDMGTPFTEKPPKSAASETVTNEDGEEIEIAAEDAEILRAKFNLYEDIRKRLVGNGIPREQVAFINEAQTDDKKAALFSKTRSGKVRVLIGSTGKMGVGTNVQDRLTAIHHHDAPWKPAEVEQRDGRGLRQGNMNPEIEIFRYVTKRSFDAFMWQTLERKASFIGQIQSGAKGLRVAEDIDNPLPEAAELKAAASGDPRIMEVAELHKKIRELEAGRRSHEQSSRAAVDAKKYAEGAITHYEKRIADLEKDVPRVKDLTGDNFEIRLGDKTVTKRKEAGEFIRDFLMENRSRHWGHGEWNNALKVGEISGFKMLVKLKRDGEQIAGNPGLGTTGDVTTAHGNDFAVFDELDPVGLVQRFERLVKSIPESLDRSKRGLAEKRDELKKLTEQIAGNKGFARQGELDKTRARLESLTKEMKAENSKPTAQKQDSDPVVLGNANEGMPLFDMGKLPPTQVIATRSQINAAATAASPLRKVVGAAAQGFGYKIVDTGLPFGFTDHWGKFHSFGTQIIDKAIPGSDIGKWMDSGWKASPELRAYIKENMTAPWAHRVWFGHDPLANFAAVVEKFGVSALPEYAGQLLKDSMTKAGIPLPGVQWLVQSGLVGDRFATAWMSLNIGEALSGGLSILGTYRLMKQAKTGEVQRGWAMVGILFKLVGGTLSANPVVLLSAAADVVILARATLGGTKAAFRKDASMRAPKPQNEMDIGLFGDDAKQKFLFDMGKLPPTQVIATRKQINAAAAEVDRITQKILGRKVKTFTNDVMPSFIPPEFIAAYGEQNRTIYITMRAAHQLANNVGHESLHALRQLGLITDNEWTALAAQARKQGYSLKPHLVDLYRREYVGRFGLTEAQFLDKLDEEAVARMFGDYVAAREKVTPFARKVIDKLLEWADAVLAALKIGGVEVQARDFMARAYGGSVGRREEGRNRGRITGQDEPAQPDNSQSLVQVLANTGTQGLSTVLKNSSMLEEALEQSGLQYRKQTSSNFSDRHGLSPSVYYFVPRKDGSEFKVRLSDHSYPSGASVDLYYGESLGLAIKTILDEAGIPVPQTLRQKVLDGLQSRYEDDLRQWKFDRAQEMKRIDNSVKLADRETARIAWAQSNPSPVAPSLDQLSVAGATDDEMSPPSKYKPLHKFVWKSAETLGGDARDYTLRMGGRLNAEVLLAFDGNGNILSDGHGPAGGNTVGISTEHAKAQERDGADIVVHHNHPLASSLSLADISMLANPGAGAVWAHTKTGFYRATLNENLRNFESGYFRKILGKANVWAGPVYDVVQSRVLDGNLDPDTALIVFTHWRSEALHRAGVIHYFTDVEYGSYDELEAAVDQSVAAIRKGLADENVNLRGHARPVRYLGDMGILPEGTGWGRGRGISGTVEERSRRGDRGPQGGPETGFEQDGLILGNTPDGSGGGTVPPAGVAVDADAQEELEKYAASINLHRINSTDDIKRLIAHVAEEAGNFVAERRGKISHEQTVAMAEELGLTEAQLLSRKIGDAWNNAYIFAARTLLIKSGERVLKLADRAAKSNSKTDLGDALRAVQRHLAIQEQVSGLATEAGRALDQFNIMAAKDFGTALDQILAGARTNMSGIKAKMGGEEALAHELVTMIAQLKDPSQVSKFIAKAYKATIWDMVREFWVAGLLSGLRTFTTNLVGNLGVAVWQVPTAGVAAAIGAVRGGPDRVYFSEVAARLNGLVAGSWEGARLAKDFFLTGDSAQPATRLDLQHREAIPGKVGYLVRTPFRVMEGGDQLFKAMNRRAELHAIATRQALKEKRTGQDYLDRVAEIVDKPSMAMQRQMQDAALYGTFQRDPGPIGRMIMNLRETIPGAWIIVPFIKTGLNLSKYAVEHSPAAVMAVALPDKLHSVVGANLRGKNGRVAQDTQIAKIVMGTGIMVGVVSMVLAGVLTGGGPDDPEERAIWLAAGNQPYSVRVGNTWYSYQRMDPFALLIGTTADFVEASADMSGKAIDEVVAIIMHSVANVTRDKSWFKGPADFFDAFFSKTSSKKTMEKYGRDLASSFVTPSFLNQWAQNVDPTLRDAQTLGEKIRARLPYKSQSLLPRRNVFGEAITREGSWGPDLLSPIWTTTVKDNPLASEMLALGYYPSMPNRTVNGHKLTPEQYDLYVELSGKQAVKTMTKLMARENWSRLEPDGKTDKIKDAFNEARDDARTALKRKWLELRHKPVKQ